MAIIENSPLGFSEENECDCRTNDFCQIVAKEDNTFWQVAAQCDNAVIVGDVKLPCENNMVGDLTELFANKNSSWVDTTNPGEVSFFPDYIRLSNANGAANIVGTSNDFLTEDRYYVLRYTIAEYTEGTIKTLSYDQLDNPINGPTRQANGTYTEVIPAGTQGRFGFVYGSGGSSPETSCIITNIFVSCVRFAQIWDVSTLLASEIEFTGQTTFCKIVNVTGFDMHLRDTYLDQLVTGQKYKICLTLTQQAQGLYNDIVLNFGATANTITASGQYCYEIVYDGTGVYIEIPVGFLGCIQDIQITLAPIIRMELYDENGVLVPDGLVTEEINGTLKASLDPDLPVGCYQIGVADSCANFKHQFFGNVLDVETYSAQFTLPGGTVFVQPNTAESPGNFLGEILFKDAVCCGKTYTGQIQLNFFITEDQYTMQDVFVNIYIGGTLYSFEPGTGAEGIINLEEVEAGCDNSDLRISIGINLSDESGTGTIPLNLNLTDTTKTLIEMDADQLCPELYSTCLQVVESAPCDTVLVKYRNDQNALGFDYESDGYTEADNFYNQMRLEAKVWKATRPITISIQKLSTGFRNKSYADIAKKVKLNTKPLPEGMHNALAIALEHRTLIIDGKEYVSDNEDYSPEWNKSSLLAPVEIDLFKQEPRLLNTLC